VFYPYVISGICLVQVLPAIWPRRGLVTYEHAKIAMVGILFFVLFPWAFNAALHYNSARGGVATFPIQTLLVAQDGSRARVGLPFSIPRERRGTPQDRHQLCASRHATAFRGRDIAHRG